MDVLLIVLGGLCVIFGGILLLASHNVLKNNKNFDKLYSELTDDVPYATKEMVYMLTAKIHRYSIIALIAGMLLLTAGILLKIM